MNKRIQEIITRCKGIRCLLLLPLAFSGVSVVRAHEMGSMKVMVLFLSEGHYQIDVTLDPEHLRPGLTPSEAGSETFREAFRRDIRVSFDGDEAAVQDAPSAAPIESRATGALAKKIFFHYEGVVPRGARSFRWSHASASGAYLLGVRNEGDQDVMWQWMEGSRTSEPFAMKHAPPPLTRGEVVRLYLGLGFTHIVPGGVDHILFVLGLFFLSSKRKTILAQVTAFTIAHSITLGLTIYGVLSLSPRVVAPLIALSIVYVAVENLVLTEAMPWRVAIVFCFGLLHGMGFAGVLRELGLPRSNFFTALVSFNVGIEAGQLAVVAAAFLSVGLWFGRKPWYRSYLTAPASASIALVGLYWTVQRVFL